MPRQFTFEHSQLYATNKKPIHDVAYKQGQDLFATASAKEAALWRLSSSDSLASVAHPDTVYTVGCGTNALATGCKDLSIRMLDYTTQQTIHAIPTGLRCVLVEWVDHSLLAVASNSPDLSLYDLTSGQIVRKLRGHTRNLYRVAWFNSSCLLASVGYDCTAKLWDIAYDHCLMTFEGHTSAVGCVVDLPSHNMVATGADDFKVKLWDKSTGTCLSTMAYHTGFMDSMEYLSRVDVLLSGCSNGHLVEVDPCIPVKVGIEDLASRVSGIEAVEEFRTVLVCTFSGDLIAKQY